MAWEGALWPAGRVLQTWSLSSCAAKASAKPIQAAAQRPSVVVARPKYRLAESYCAEAAVVVRAAHRSARVIEMVMQWSDEER